MVTEIEEPIAEDAPAQERYAKHRARAESLLAHADEILGKAELSATDRLQASEKIWGSVTHTLKAIAATRGWKFHRTMALDSLRAYLASLTTQAERDEITSLYRAAHDYHVNFYQDHVPAGDLQHGVGAARKLNGKLWDAGALIPADAAPPTGLTAAE